MIKGYMISKGSKIMKKIVLSIIILIFLTGCSGVFNLDNFVIPDDLEFIALIEELNTPEKICNYMEDNFECEKNYKALSPYNLFLNKKGDCNDFALFAIFMAHYNDYETYQIFMKFPFWVYETSAGHVIGVFKEGSFYNISDTIYYIECNRKTFKKIMELYPNYNSYVVCDYDGNIVEIGYNN